MGTATSSGTRVTVAGGLVAPCSDRISTDTAARDSLQAIEGSDPVVVPPSGWRMWVAGARPPTLTAAVAPVVVGTAAAAGSGVSAVRALAALVVAVAIQVGTNYVNDAADGERGTDDARVGPLRLAAAGLATPRQLRQAALAAFAVAGSAGLVLVVVVGPELIPVGVLSMLAGWAYTAGPKPYGYLGLGEVFVFAFFGLVATVGSAYVQTEEITLLAASAAVPVGLLATALLVVNNLRDIPTDAVAGKRTLAVRIGVGRTRRLYLRLVAGALGATLVVAVQRPAAILALAAVFAAVAPVRAVADRVQGPRLIVVLVETGRVQAVYGALLAMGLAVGA